MAIPKTISEMNEVEINQLIDELRKRRQFVAETLEKHRSKSTPKLESVINKAEKKFAQVVKNFDQLIELLNKIAMARVENGDMSAAADWIKDASTE